MSDTLHQAVCDAVGQLNTVMIPDDLPQVRAAKDLLRNALVAYADAPPRKLEDENNALRKENERLLLDVHVLRNGIIKRDVEPAKAAPLQAELAEELLKELVDADAERLRVSAAWRDRTTPAETCQAMEDEYQRRITGVWKAAREHVASLRPA